MTQAQLNELLHNNPSLAARNAQLTGEPEKPMTVVATTDVSKLNKTEKAYLEWLKGWPYVWIGVQNITLKLGDDCRYTPDFFVLGGDGELQAREVKGFFRDDAMVKIKVAARLFPFIRFQVVKKNGTGWDHEDVKP